MNWTELCLSSRANQLLRWQQAFPKGKIFGSLQQLAPHLRSDLLVFLHAEALTTDQLAEAMGTIGEACPGLRMVVISSMPNQAGAMAAFQAGAAGYCHALATAEMLQQVALVVRNGGLWVGPDLLPLLVGAIGQIMAPAALSQEPSALEKLTLREQQVARQVCSGASNKEIAQTLGITERTVKAHMGSIFEKLEIRDRLQLALLVTQDDSEGLQQASL